MAKRIPLFDITRFCEGLEYELRQGDFSRMMFDDDDTLSIEIIYDSCGDRIKISDLKRALSNMFDSIWVYNDGTTSTYHFKFTSDQTLEQQKFVLEQVKKILDPY